MPAVLVQGATVRGGHEAVVLGLQGECVPSPCLDPANHVTEITASDLPNGQLRYVFAEVAGASRDPPNAGVLNVCHPLLD